MCYGQGHARQGCYQLSLTAAPGKNSSPTGTQDTPVGEEDAGPSREINKRQKETVGNDMSWIKEDSKLTPLKWKLRCSQICQYLQGHHWDCPNRMLHPGGTAWNQYANQAPSGTKSSTQDYAVWSNPGCFQLENPSFWVQVAVLCRPLGHLWHLLCVVVWLPSSLLQVPACFRGHKRRPHLSCRSLWLSCFLEPQKKDNGGIEELHMA